MLRKSRCLVVMPYMPKRCCALWVSDDDEKLILTGPREVCESSATWLVWFYLERAKLLSKVVRWPASRRFSC